MNKIGLPMYGVINTGVFGARIVAGIVTGVRFTEDKPLYELSYGKDSWWTDKITDSKEGIFEFLNFHPLERIKETHNLKIKYT